MTTKKLKTILVPLGVYMLRESKLAPAHMILESYLHKLLKYNLEPRFISCTFTPEMIDRAYAESSGVLLMGGADFHPDCYGHEPHKKTVTLDRRRDDMELRLLKRALADKKPILGICRGAQALVIASGGTLHQHVPDIVEGERHEAVGEAPYDAMITGDSSHKAILDEGSAIYKLVGKKEIMVTSAHHQAVDKPGNNLKVTGRSPGGVAEVIEHTDPNYFCMGVQSHPEAEANGDLEVVFKAFASAL